MSDSTTPSGAAGAQTRTRRPLGWLPGAAGIALIVVLLSWAALSPVQGAAPGSLLPFLAPQNPGPDLVISTLRLSQAVPAANTPVDIEVRVTNQGTTASPAFFTYLYTDLAAPPTPGTPDRTFFQYFGLNPGQSITFTYQGHTFATVGCDHNVYAWVDRDNEVVEDNEENNLSLITFCVGTTPTPTATPSPTISPTPTLTPTATDTPTPAPCQADAFEPDLTCGAAAAITTNGLQQIRNLCPVGDEDWAKFTATAGITYTVATSNTGVDADTVLAVYNQCNQPPASTSDPAFGNGAQLVFQAPTTGTYYVRVKHHNATYGQNASYQLSVTGATDCAGDTFEQDNSCSAARDVTVGGPLQRRRFCASQDADWIKFPASSGATYAITPTLVGPDAHPQLTVLDQCGAQTPVTQGQNLQWTAAADQTYYIGIQNQNPDIFGPTTNYDLRVQMTACAPDDFEGDNTPTDASLSLPTGAGQDHDFCPLGDLDWTRFQAQAGQLYVMETFELADDADTKICLYQADGSTQIACNDDGGGALASRLRWTAAAAGDYYLRVENRKSGVSGPTTGYNLAITAGETYDAFEQDGTKDLAKTIASDGTPQHHNFTPDGDQDWVKFEAVAGEPYTMQSACVGGDCDTIMHLIGSDGTTELSQNDDYGSGPGSRITYIFPQAGTYYVRVHHYRSNRSGNGTRYDLTVTRNYQPPTPTPTATPTTSGGPTPTPTVTPPPSGIQTLIVTNRERLSALYGETAATDVMNALALLADHPLVKGQIVQVENNAAANTAYIQWANNLRDTNATQAVSAAVRNVILSYLANNPNVQYIVLVGNDMVIPFRRFPDRTRYSESRYQAFVTGNTTIWAACRDNMALTDDYYADREPNLVGGREIYVPDFGLGRLPEGPNEITVFINNFIANSEIHLQRALVTGYDFVADTGVNISTTISSDLGPDGSVDGGLNGEFWQASSLRERQLNTVPRFDVQSINGHASHHLEGAPVGGSVADTDIRSYGSSDLRGSLVFTVGCHSGLNDVGGLPAGLDLAQAFFGRGANYIANTGYGWGSNNGLGWSERLMSNFTKEWTKGASVPIGRAFMAAKQRYFTETSNFDAYDEKAMQESTLYGLPQYRLVSGGVLGPEDPFPGVSFTTTLPLGDEEVNVGKLDLSLNGSFTALDETQTTDGAFYSINDSTQVAANQPVQPQIYANVTSQTAGRAHGVIIRGGSYTDVPAVDPLVAQPVHEWVPRADWAEPAALSDGWWPPEPANVQALDTGRPLDQLVTQIGQFDASTGQQRLYDDMSLDLLYSDSEDWTPPAITLVSESVDLHRRVAKVKVEASDPSGIMAVVVLYTHGDGVWSDQDLDFDIAADKWLGEIPATERTSYWVQVIDKAGNVASDTNKGYYYALAESFRQLFLPTLLRLRP